MYHVSSLVCHTGNRKGYAVEQLVEGLRFEIEDCGFEFPVGILEFFMDLIFSVSL